ncbi:unnamed protein product [Symbiodinium sp. CCMP2592]|nr:unnamed protein product [Symbiodinium sp. CCMP2592]
MGGPMAVGPGRLLRATIPHRPGLTVNVGIWALGPQVSGQSGEAVHSTDSSCGSLDVSFGGGTPTSCQKSAFENLQAAVLAGDAPSILNLVESFEQQGLITEGTFHWKVVELAVETQEDVPPHVAGWAIEDALANLKDPKYRDDLRIVTANVSSWRKDLCPWVAQLGASVVMLQETHLCPDQPDLIEGQLGVYGFNVFSVPGHPTGRGGTSGGMAICFRKHLNVRRVHQFFKAGAGFQVAAIRLRDTDCYLVNLYLKAGEGFQSATNSQILANLLAFLTSARGIYFAAGDLNEDFEVIAASSFAQEAKGHWISSGESTCAGGGNIDYGLLSPILAAGAKLAVDWDTPFAPHAALHWTLQLQHFDFKLPQLVAFKPAPVQPQPFLSSVVADPRGEQVAIQSQELHLLGTEVATPGLSALFANLSRDVEYSIFGYSQGRGANVQVSRRPLVVPTAPALGWGGAKASFWQRMVVWLQACSKRLHVSSFGRSASLRLGSIWAGATSDREAFQADLQVFLESEDVRVLPGLLATAQEQHKAHQRKWQQEKSASYGQWLRQSTQKGMRPLFRSVKAEEVVTVRPFLDAPLQERIYLRWRHWFELWSHPAGVDRDLLASLKHAAQEQARLLHPIDLERAVGFFKKVPAKAPGLDGWTCEMLRNLSVEAVQAILEFFHHCEREASWPDQMVFALIALLPKSEKRERPIALLHILYRAWAKLRWPLVAAWQTAYAARARWDKAVPGGQALDVALARLMLGESVRRSKSHLITLFLDMETFYDRCVFDDVIRSGLSLAYPCIVPSHLAGEGLPVIPFFCSGLSDGIWKLEAAKAMSKILDANEKGGRQVAETQPTGHPGEGAPFTHCQGLFVLSWPLGPSGTSLDPLISLLLSVDGVARSACVSWAIGAYELRPEGPVRVASITCYPVQPLSVAGAEQQAAFELLGRASGDLDITVDCKAVLHVLEKSSPPLDGPVPWGEVWADRSRARVTWVPSHKTSSYFADKGLPEWRRVINEDVDSLCGKRAAQVYRVASKPELHSLDELWEEVCLHLAKKIGYVLLHRKDKHFPWLLDRGDPESRNDGDLPRVIAGDKFVKPKLLANAKKVAPPNKKQRLKQMLGSPDPTLGHVWRDCEAKASNNFAIQCTVCSLYVEQCNAPAVFDRKVANPCRDIAAAAACKGLGRKVNSGTKAASESSQRAAVTSEPVGLLRLLCPFRYAEQIPI